MHGRGNEKKNQCRSKLYKKYVLDSVKDCKKFTISLSEDDINKVPFKKLPPDTGEGFPGAGCGRDIRCFQIDITSKKVKNCTEKQMLENIPAYKIDKIGSY